MAKERKTKPNLKKLTSEQAPVYYDVDHEDNYGYIRYSFEDVNTVYYGANYTIDVDKSGKLVGIELLSLDGRFDKNGELKDVKDILVTII